MAARQTDTPQRERGDIRRQIVAAADEVIQRQGLRAATTRAIAECAGCAEGSIYRYFPDKHALLLEVMKERYPDFTALMEALPEMAGTATVRRNLEKVATAAIRFYHGIMPVVAGAMAEPKLLEEQRRYFEETKRGPMRTFGVLSTYLRREQKLGRVATTLSPDYAARTLLGACWSHAFMVEHLGAAAATAPDETYAKEIVRCLMEGIEPRQRQANGTRSRSGAKTGAAR